MDILKFKRDQYDANNNNLWNHEAGLVGPVAVPVLVAHLLARRDEGGRQRSSEFKVKLS